ncbi:MAG: hypothetical protein BZY88_12370 [SAR202 cluster bacterium Io17-Chloro-G9]|nr:MAG: hypothetical protein BZY88_12370 [SAR202 cluster bacterium Io17-Chloro-G9]
MLKSVEGIYRKGRIDLAEAPADVLDETRVIVTFLGADSIDLATHGIDETRAADLRGRLAAFIEEWESPEMDLYDDYDSANARI